MAPIRAVLYGVGEMGSISARLMLEKGVEIVGAIARSDQKVGRDLGDVAGLGRETGVVIRRDAAELLAETKPDIVLIATTNYLREQDHASHLEVSVRSGANVITISTEALFPWLTEPELSRELDQLAKEHGVTLTAGGVQDVFWVTFGSALMAACHRVEAVRGRLSYNVEDYGRDPREWGIGSEPAEVADLFEVADDGLPSLGLSGLHGLIAAAGMTAKAATREARPEVARDAVPCKSLARTIEPGQVVGRTDVDRVMTAEGVEFSLELTGRIFRPGETDQNEWAVVGEPNLVLRNPDIHGRLTTCTLFVNRIPDVINAAPGFITVDRLPPVKYRHGPLDTYVGV